MPDTYTCPYCHRESVGATTSCPTCGAPVDVRLRTTSGGWTELPAIPDMARIQAGQSSVQIEGSTVPVADWKLAEGDRLYFTHDVVLWQEPSIELSALPLARAWTRMRAGLPLIMLQSAGSGHIAFSHDTPGELLAIPLAPGASVDVREGHLLVATGGVGYDWTETGVWYVTSGSQVQDQAAGLKLLKMGTDLAGIGGGGDQRANESRWHYPVGQFLDRFSAGDTPGLVMIGAGGNAFTRTLAEGETMLVKPPALLFKDPTVAMQLHVEYPGAGMKLWRSWGNRYLWLRLWGPGRVALESCYEAADDPGTDFRDMSPATQNSWLRST